MLMHKAEVSLTRSAFTYLVASVEFFHSRFKGHLGRCHAALDGMGIGNPTKHTLPLLSAGACLFCTHLSSLGYARLGGGLVFQQRRGLIPGELLSLRPCDLAFTDEQGSSFGKQRVDIALGARTGTKLKRAQSVQVFIDDDPDVALFLRWVRDLTPPDCLLFPYSLPTYRRLLAKVSAKLGLSQAYTPHGPRAGYATEATVNRIPFDEIRNTGRWTVDSSLRTYIDVVSAQLVTSEFQSLGLAPALDYARVHWLSFVSPAVLAQAYRR